MKTKTLLIAAVMFLGLTAAAFAQATYTVGSIPVTAVNNTGQVEQTGDITFSQVQNGNGSVLGTVTVTYPAPITVGMSGDNLSTSSGVRIIGAVGYTASLTNPPTTNLTIGILSVSSGATTGQGQVVIQIPGGIGGVTSASFTLTGVRVAVAGTTLTSLSATISATNNAITAGQTGVTVINSIAPGISGICSSSGSSCVYGGTASISATNNSDQTLSATLVVKEGFLNAWGTPANKTNAGVRITLSAAPPAGVEITFPASAATINPSNGDLTGGGFQTMAADATAVGTTGAVTIASDSSSLAVYYRATTATDPTIAEYLVIPVTVTVTKNDATFPLPIQTITAVVSLAPIGAAFGDNNALIGDPKIPRYAAADVGPTNLVVISGNTTTLLMPFAQTVTVGSYDTGIAISNTTEDPGKTATGFSSPIAQSGTITFYFFPQSHGTTTPANFTYTTGASSPGSGLDATGKVPSGSTYVVLLSQLLQAAAAPADFSGYIFAVTNFTNAHGLYVLSNFTTFSQGSLMLVVTTSRTTVPENMNN